MGRFYQLDPLTDSRWQAFVSSQRRSSVFHSVPWLKALHRTYGFVPEVFTSSPAGSDLHDGVVFCRVTSWLTGARLVSLPCSDHCEPLTAASEGMSLLSDELADSISRDELRYIEIRPLDYVFKDSTPWRPAESHVLHTLDLSPALPALFENFHASSTQRKIRRAERSGLGYTQGRSGELLSQFYGLLLLTRRRHGIPPQPRLWFENLIDCFGDALTIRVASHEGRPVASILTLRHKNQLVYKYGCADQSYFSLGGIHLLFWHTIQEAKREGALSMDLGRSEATHTGLITFKDRWGATRQPLTYFRLSSLPLAHRYYNGVRPTWGQRWAGRAISQLPDWIVNPLGRVLYRHFV